MKKINIGNLEYNLIENLFDISDERFTVFKQWLLQVFEQIDRPLFAASFSKYVTYHNAGQHADGLIEWYNFKKGSELRELNYDAYSFCFALLCIAEGENQNDCSKGTQLEKLAAMRQQGLMRGMVEETVENFIKAFPSQFGVYLEMLKIMKTQLSEEILKK